LKEGTLGEGELFVCIVSTFRFVFEAFDVVVSFSGSDLLKHTVYVLVVCPGLHFQPGRAKSVRKRSV
jgi:hypothetical protein